MLSRIHRGIPLACLAVCVTAGAGASCTSHGRPPSGSDVLDGPGGIGSGSNGNTVLRASFAYRASRSKRVYVMTGETVQGSMGNSSDGAAVTVLSDVGAWNATFRHVAAIDFGGAQAGAQLLIFGSTFGANFNPTIEDDGNYLANRMSEAAGYFGTQRDADETTPYQLAIPHPPAHLSDQTALVYSPPIYAKGPDGAPLLSGALEPMGAPIDVSGGWMNGSSYVKYVESASFATLPLFVVALEHPDDPAWMPALNEAMWGTDWLEKMWDDATSTLYYQVGLARGNATFRGDEEVWRSPADDDAAVAAEDPLYYLRSRPVFRSAPPGSKLSPNLAGRLAASFALCARANATLDAMRANRCLIEAEHAFALADTAPSELLTTSPPGLYAEVEWRDDLELGAAEIALALRAGVDTTNVPMTDPVTFTKQAAHWAHEYIQSTTARAMPFGVLDVSALAHAELAAAIQPTGSSGLEVTVDDLIADLRKQLSPGLSSALQDRFSAAVPLGTPDPVPRMLGYATTAGLYEKLTMDTKYQAFEQRQIEWVLGANAWGGTFVITGYPQVSQPPICLHHQIANLLGALGGEDPRLHGGVLSGPSNPKTIKPPFPVLEGQRSCSQPPGDSDRFDVAFYDDVGNAASSDARIEAAALSVLALTR